MTVSFQYLQLWYYEKERDVRVESNTPSAAVKFCGSLGERATFCQGDHDQEFQSGGGNQGSNGSQWNMVAESHIVTGDTQDFSSYTFSIYTRGNPTVKNLSLSSLILRKILNNQQGYGRFLTPVWMDGRMNKQLLKLKKIC